jgi:hypothetical protein
VEYDEAWSLSNGILVLENQLNDGVVSTRCERKDDIVLQKVDLVYLYYNFFF